MASINEFEFTSGAIRVFRDISNDVFSHDDEKRKRKKKERKKRKGEVDAQITLRNNFHLLGVPSGEVGNINLLERQRLDSEYSMPI